MWAMLRHFEQDCAVAEPVICSDLYCDGWDDRASELEERWFE